MTDKARTILSVSVGDDASMWCPTDHGAWCARYSPQNLNLYDAACIMDSYMYLVRECTKAEAWRRIKLMRTALEATGNAS